MYRKVRCRLTPVEVPKELVQVPSTVLRDGETHTLVEYKEVSQSDLANQNLDPTVVTVDALLASGQTIQGNVSMDVTDPADLENMAQQVAEHVAGTLKTE